MPEPVLQPELNPKLWPHQQQALNFAGKKNWQCLLAMEMGTGKTRVAIEAVKNYPGRLFLVLCPSPIVDVWKHEIDQWGGPDMCCITAKGTNGKKRASHIMQQMSRHIVSADKIVVVVNYEYATRSKKFFGPVIEQLVTDYNLQGIVLDESHKAGHVRTASHRWIRNLSARLDPGHLLLLLSGTPMAGSPETLFGQFRIIDPTVFGTSIVKFRARYAVQRNLPGVPVPVTMGWHNLKDMEEKVSTSAWVCHARDVLNDLPIVRHQQINFDLPSVALRQYREMENELITEIDGKTVTADNALTKLLRLQQIATTSESVVPARMDVLAGICEPAGDQPVIVFCRFLRDLAAARQVARQIGRPYQEISGQRRDLKSGRMIPVPKNNQLLAVQIQSGSLGIDLTQSRVAVFYSRNFSWSDYQQSLARLVRAGQKSSSTMFYNIVAAGTVDQRIAEVVDDRTSMVEQIIRSYKGENNVHVG